MSMHKKSTPVLNIYFVLQSDWSEYSCSLNLLPYESIYLSVKQLGVGKGKDRGLSLPSNFEDLTQCLSKCIVRTSQLGKVTNEPSCILKVGLGSLHINMHPTFDAGVS